MTEDENDEYSLRAVLDKISAWLRYLLSKWVFIGSIVILGVFWGMYKYFTTKPLYKATITYVFGDSPSNSGVLGGFASQFGLPAASSGFALFEGANLVDLMKSRIILQKVILSKLSNDNDTLIGDKYIEIYKLRQEWSKNKSPLSTLYFKDIQTKDSLSLNFNIMLNQLMGSIKDKNLSFEKTNKTSNLSAITFTSENELLSKNFLDVFANVVSKYYIETKTAKYSKNVRILQKQTDSIRRVLGGAVVTAAELSDVNPNPNLSRKSLFAPTQNKQIDVQASTAILMQLIQNLESAKLQLRNETPLFQIVDQPILPLDVIKKNLMQSCLLWGFVGFFMAVAFFTLQLFFKNLK